MKIFSIIANKLPFWIPITFVAVLGLTLTVSLYVFLYDSSREELIQKNRMFSVELTGIIVDRMNIYIHELDAVKRFYNGSSYISRNEFAQFVQPILKEKGFKAIEWIPRVPLKLRKQYEERARKEGFPDFNFTELDEKGKMQKAKIREEYFPVFYIEPYYGNEMILGFLSPFINSARGASMAVARDSATPYVSEKIPLINTADTGGKILIVLPVYNNHLSQPVNVKERRERLIGFIQGILLPDRALKSVMVKFTSESFSVKIFDISDGNSKTPLCAYRKGGPENYVDRDKELYFNRYFEYCGRKYQIECIPSKAFVENYVDKSYIPITLFCALFSTMLVLYLAMLLMQRYKAEKLVWSRTRALQESEERLKFLIKNSSDFISIIDAEGKYRFVSPSVRAITGFLPEELIGRNFIEFVHPEERDYAFSVYCDCLSIPEKKVSIQFNSRKKEGGYVILEAIGQNLLHIPGIMGLVFNVRDITERKHNEKELIAAKEKAEEMNRAKSSFFANMSHELRTPLHGILGLAQILEESIRDEEQKQLMEMISKSGKRLMDTLNMILTLSRAESSKQEINYKVVDINSSAHNAIKLFESVANEKNLYLRFTSESEVLLLKTDEQMLDVLLNNMIDNAIKYTEKGGAEISTGLKIYKGSQYAVIKVSDTGIGISENNLAVIFDEFRQVSEGFNRSFEGTGLGLSIMKKYVELLHGEIFVESEIGKGTTFSIYLPYSEGICLQTTPPEKINKKRVAESFKKINKNILLVDDDKVAYDILQKWLKDVADVDYAADADEAAVLLKARLYPLVFLDINLKDGVNGVDLLKKLKSIPGYEDVPVVACTAYAMNGDKEKLISEGFDRYISKPFKREELIEVVKEIISV